MVILRDADGRPSVRTGTMKNVDPNLVADNRSLASQFDALLLDLDGVLYIGEDPVPFAAQSLAACGQDNGMRWAYVTNNASRTPDEVAEVLMKVGIAADRSQVVTSAQVAAQYLSTILKPGDAVLVVGGAGLEVALAENRLVPVRSLSDNPKAVVQGFHPRVGWRDLAMASDAVNTGIPWVASNTDMTIPTATGIAPGNGTLVAAVAAATGRRPIVVGKPNTPALEAAVQRLGATRPLVVGDRLDTDIEAANRAGLPSLLVMTGVTGAAALFSAKPEQRPTFVCRDLRGLNEPFLNAVTTAESVYLGGWSVMFSGPQVEIDTQGARGADALRAVALACWQVADRTGERADVAPSVLALVERVMWAQGS